MGTIGNAKRFIDSKYKLLTPGVGSYHIAPFKSLGKVTLTAFTVDDDIKQSPN